jgi:hypothetical protein
MVITRVAHGLIVAVVAVAAVAIAIVLRPDSASHPPGLEFQQVINYSRYGVIDSINAKGNVLTVHFRDDFDTKAQFGTDVHTYEATLPSGQDLVVALTEAGVPAPDAGGPAVSIDSQ